MMMMMSSFVIIKNNEEEHTVRPGVVLARATEHGVELHMSNNKIKKGVWKEELQDQVFGQSVSVKN